MKSLLFLFLVLFIPLTSKEQSYVPLPDSNVVWEEVLLPYPPGPMPSYMEHIEYTISGDTVINNTLYDKLLKTNFDVNCSEIFTGPYFAGGIRNDSVEKKVYYYDLTSSQEWLLYDFTLDVGDTVPQTFNNISYPELIVGSIDSVQIGEQFRKRYIYARDTYFPIQVIEGIGAETGLFGYMEYFEVIYYLRCFHQDNNLLWINPRADSCRLETDTCLSVSIQEQMTEEELIRIFPNPASDWILFNLSSEKPGLEGIIRLEIYNILGEKVGECIILPENEISSYDVSGLPDGIYLAMIIKNHNIVSNGKFVVSR